MLFMLSTALIGFSGSNNWAMRGAIVPAVVLACFFADRLVSAPMRTRAVLVRCGFAIAFALSVVAHLNELALLGIASVGAPAYTEETQACKLSIRYQNEAPASAMALVPPECQSKLAPYHLERRFQKPQLSTEDRELMGRGPLRLF